MGNLSRIGSARIGQELTRKMLTLTWGLGTVDW